MKKQKIMLLLEITLFIMIVGTIASYAAGSNPPSEGVRYTNNGQATVQGALNDLYGKIDSAGCNSWTTRTPDTSQIAVGGSRTYYAGIYPSNFTVSCANKTCPTCPICPTTSGLMAISATRNPHISTTKGNTNLMFKPTADYFVVTGQGGREKDSTITVENATIVGDLTVPIVTNYTVTNGLSIWKVKNKGQSVTVTRTTGGNYGRNYLYVQELKNVPSDISNLKGGLLLTAQGEQTVPAGVKMILWTAYPENWYNAHFIALENLVILPAFHYNQQNGAATYVAVVQDTTKEARFTSSAIGNYGMNQVRYKYFN